MTTTYHIAQLQRDLPDGLVTTSHWTAAVRQAEAQAESATRLAELNTQVSE